MAVTWAFHRCPHSTLHCCHIPNIICLCISMWNKCRSKVNKHTGWAASLWRYSQASKFDVSCSGYSWDIANGRLLRRWWQQMKQSLFLQLWACPHMLSIAHIGLNTRRIVKKDSPTKSLPLAWLCSQGIAGFVIWLNGREQERTKQQTSK